MEITESWEQKYSSPAEGQVPLEMSNQESNTSERLPAFLRLESVTLH